MWKTYIDAAKPPKNTAPRVSSRVNNEAMTGRGYGLVRIPSVKYCTLQNLEVMVVWGSTVLCINLCINKRSHTHRLGSRAIRFEFPIVSMALRT